MRDDRKHLTATEVDKLIATTKGSRNETRDRCLLLLMFRHGLRSATMANRPGLPCPLTRTSSGTLAASPLRIKGQTRG